MCTTYCHDISISRCSFLIELSTRILRVLDSRMRNGQVKEIRLIALQSSTPSRRWPSVATPWHLRTQRVTSLTCVRRSSRTRTISSATDYISECRLVSCLHQKAKHDSTVRGNTERTTARPPRISEVYLILSSGLTRKYVRLMPMRLRPRKAARTC